MMMTRPKGAPLIRPGFLWAFGATLLVGVVALSAISVMSQPWPENTTSSTISQTAGPSSEAPKVSTNSSHLSAEVQKMFDAFCGMNLRYIADVFDCSRND